MSNNYAIEVKGLCKSFGKLKAVDNLNLQVERGEVFGFLGPNGGGKTTTIRLLCGLMLPDSGEGHCLGFDIVKNANEIKKRAGYMTQHFSLYHDLSVTENLDFVARMYQIKHRQDSIRQTLKDFDLYDRRDQLAGHLSGGWKQRVSLAACVLRKPDLLLLDEPTAGVDPYARCEFWEHIYQLSLRGITSLVSTHYMDEAKRCTRLLYLSHGHSLAQGTVTDIIEQVGLRTWILEADGLSAIDTLNTIEEELRQSDIVEQIMMLGNTLHVSSHDQEALQVLMQKFKNQKDLLCFQVKMNLEDAFIYLVRRTRK